MVAGLGFGICCDLVLLLVLFSGFGLRVRWFVLMLECLGDFCLLDEYVGYVIIVPCDLCVCAGGLFVLACCLDVLFDWWVV